MSKTSLNGQVRRLANSIGAILDADDLADTFQISKRTVWRMVAMGRLPQPDMRSGRIVRWMELTITRWIERQARRNGGVL